MMEKPSISPEAAEPEELGNLQFLYRESAHSQVAVVIWETSRQRMRLMDEVQSLLPEYKHVEVNFTGIQVVSMMRELEKHPVMRSVWQSPRTVEGRLKHVVHITGLEGTLSVESYQKEKHFLPQLNYERELIFRQIPALLIFWLTPYTYQQLRNQAADFFSWLALKISLPPREEDIEPAPPPTPPYTPPPHFTPDIEARIKSVEQRYESILWTHAGAERTGADCQKELLEIFKAAQDYKQAEKTTKRLIAHLERLENTEAEQAETWRGLGSMLGEVARWEDACIALHTAENLLPKMNAEALHGSVFNALGLIYKGKREWEKAIGYFQKAIEIREKNDRYYLGGAFHNIGMVYAEQYKWEEALEYYRNAIQISEAENNLIFLGRHYHVTGSAFLNQRLWKQALLNFQISIARKEDAGSLNEISSGLQSIGEVFARQYQWEKALFYYERALEWSLAGNYQLENGQNFMSVGMALRNLHKWNEAKTSYDQALQWLERTGSEFYFGNVYLQIATLYSDQREWQPALANCKKAIEWFEKTNNYWPIGLAYHGIGYIFHQQDRLDEAIEHYEKAVVWKLKVNNIHDIGETYHQIGVIYADQRQWQPAMEHYIKALEWKRRMGNYYDLGSTYHNIGAILEQQERIEEARGYYELAVEIAETWGAPLHEKTFFARSLDRVLTNVFQNVTVYAQQDAESVLQEPEFDYNEAPAPDAPPAAEVSLPVSVLLRMAQNALDYDNFEAADEIAAQILQQYSEKPDHWKESDWVIYTEAHLLVGVIKGKIRISAGMQKPSVPESEYLRKAYSLAKSRMEIKETRFAGAFLKTTWYIMNGMPKTTGIWWLNKKKPNKEILELRDEAIRLTQNLTLDTEATAWLEKINQFYR